MIVLVFLAVVASCALGGPYACDWWRTREFRSLDARRARLDDALRPTIGHRSRISRVETAPVTYSEGGTR